MVSIHFREISGWTAYRAGRKCQTITVDPHCGTGYIYAEQPLQSGVSIICQDYALYGSGKIQIHDPDDLPSVISFPFAFSGIEQIFPCPGVTVGDGISAIGSSMHNPTPRGIIRADTPVQTLVVCMEPSVFEQLTEKSHSQLVEMLDLLDSSARKKSWKKQSQQMDFAQKICARQAFDTFVNTPEDRLFLEAKALELMALQLRQLEHLTGNAAIPEKKPVPHHADKIHYACEILKKEMADPPDKLTLSRKVGLNHDQLVQGFRQILDLAPFEYLRAIRLEKAKELIGSGERNVTEAAFEVGYSNLSYFTKNFRKEFGVNPKAYAVREKNGNGCK